MTEPTSNIQLSYHYEDEQGSQSINMEFDGDLLLSQVLKQLQRFLSSIGYGCDVLTSSVDVQGEAYEHSSEDLI